jgi:hypothetical protein
VAGGRAAAHESVGPVRVCAGLVVFEFGWGCFHGNLFLVVFGERAIRQVRLGGHVGQFELSLPLFLQFPVIPLIFVYIISSLSFHLSHTLVLYIHVSHCHSVRLLFPPSGAPLRSARARRRLADSNHDHRSVRALVCARCRRDRTLPEAAAGQFAGFV